MILKDFEKIVAAKLDNLSAVVYCSKYTPDNMFKDFQELTNAREYEMTEAFHQQYYQLALVTADKLMCFGVQIWKNHIPNSTIEKVIKIIKATLNKKAKQYALGDDRLSNFKKQANQLGNFPIQALLGNVNKHIACAIEYLETGSLIPYKLAEELSKDIMCYSILMTAIAIEELNTPLNSVYFNNSAYVKTDS